MTYVPAILAARLYGHAHVLCRRERVPQELLGCIEWQIAHKHHTALSWNITRCKELNAWKEICKQMVLCRCDHSLDQSHDVNIHTLAPAISACQFSGESWLVGRVFVYSTFVVHHCVRHYHIVPRFRTIVSSITIVSAFNFTIMSAQC